MSLGDSKCIVGENEAKIHMDFVVNKLTVTMDGKKLMVGGELKL
jgi:leucyl aminopeptidase (aminopeptidase T)